MRLGYAERRSGKVGLLLAWVVLAVAPSACVDGLSFQEDSGSGGKNLAGAPDDSGASAGENSGGGPSGGQGTAGNEAGGGPGSGSATSDSGGSDSDGSDSGGSGSGASPGSGGTPDPGVNGKPGGALVSLGAKMTSSNYLLVLTIGEAPGGNGESGVLVSENYRLRAGLLGTTEGE